MARASSRFGRRKVINLVARQTSEPFETRARPRRALLAFQSTFGGPASKGWRSKARARYPTPDIREPAQKSPAKKQTAAGSRGQSSSARSSDTTAGRQLARAPQTKLKLIELACCKQANWRARSRSQIELISYANMCLAARAELRAGVVSVSRSVLADLHNWPGQPPD